jgi:hypothetical protein
MGDDAVRDVDGEIIGRIARASLRREEKVPRPSYAERACATDTKATRQLAAIAYVRRFFMVCSKVGWSFAWRMYPQCGLPISVRRMPDAACIADHSAASAWCRSGNLVIPQRFFAHGQHSKGDRHMYASRTRFITEALLPHFERIAWPIVTTAQPSLAGQASQIDIKAHMRRMWR